MLMILTKNRTFLEKSSIFGAWLPERSAQQNFFTYQFLFLMNPTNKTHPRTEYRFQRIAR